MYIGGEYICGSFWFLMQNIRRFMYCCTFVGKFSMSWWNCGLDVTLMSQYTCRSRFLGHWKEWYSSPMGVPLHNLQVRCSLGVWVCRPSSMSSLWLEQVPEAKGSRAEVWQARV